MMLNDVPEVVQRLYEMLGIDIRDLPLDKKIEITIELMPTVTVDGVETRISPVNRDLHITISDGRAWSYGAKGFPEVMSHPLVHTILSLVCNNRSR